MNPTILGVIGPGFLNQVPTQGLQSSSFLGVPLFLVRDSNILPQKELLWSLRVHYPEPLSQSLPHPLAPPMHRPRAANAAQTSQGLKLGIFGRHFRAYSIVISYLI